jgi:uncharacterized iron-regulated membrane protein
MFRLLLLVHRYLGIAIGLIIALWCLSGFVMMYVQYPDLNEQEYLAGLPVIDTGACCIADREVLDQLSGVDEVSVEMLAGQPVLRTRFGRDISLLVNLSSGWWFSTIDQETAIQQADAFLAASGIDGEARFLARMERDQWTVAGYFDSYRPLFLFTADDDAATHVYISGVNGQVIQATSSTERFWNWFGAVTHWIYPTALRQNTALWAQVVIWLTIASLFLVVVGIYLGIKLYGSQDDGSRSPYRGLNLWHHYSGLIFGLITVTWLFSGLLSMNPWGAFEGDVGFEERGRLEDRIVSTDEVNGIVEALGNTTLPVGTVRLSSSMVDGQLALIARDRSGTATRLNGSTLQPEPLPENTWQRVAQLIRPNASVRRAEFIESGDNYYFSHHEEVAFPVYRILFDDAEQTRYYFDATTAELIQKYDSDRRWNRWLFLGLHRGDFTLLMRQRPLWDLILLPLLIGVTIGAITGVWMGYRRLTR